MLRRFFDWLIGRKEPKLNEADKERRLRLLKAEIDSMRRGR